MYILFWVKRKKLEQELARIAKQHGMEPQWEEGGNHTKVTIGTLRSTIPRHNEINEITARSIIKYFSKGLQ